MINLLKGSIFDDTITGDLQADEIQGYEGNDYWLNGLAGNDIVVGGHGNDVLAGGEGNDFIHGDYEIGSGWVRNEDGTYTYTFAAQTGNSNDNATLIPPEALLDTFNDLLLGGDGDDIMLGSWGHDAVFGGAGNDIINGGVGNDYWLAGGTGDDVINGDQGNDILEGGEGNDVLNGGNKVGAVKDLRELCRENAVLAKESKENAENAGDTKFHDNLDFDMTGDNANTFIAYIKDSQEALRKYNRSSSQSLLSNKSAECSQSLQPPQQLPIISPGYL